MSNYHTSLQMLFGHTADMIRMKTGSGGNILADNFPFEIANIQTPTDGSIPSVIGNTITPGTFEQIAVDTGVYTRGVIRVAGDANLVDSNIASGVSVFGVTGTAVLASSLPNASEVEF